MTSSPFPPEIVATLTPGETVRWSGQPAVHVFMLRGLTSVAYGATWAILGSFWYMGSGGIGDRSAFEGWWRLVPLLSLPFILAGLSFFFYPMRLGARARHTWYVVTDRRVLIAELKPKAAPKIRDFAPGEITFPVIKNRFDGLDEIVLTREAQRNPHLKPRLDSGFFGLRDGVWALDAMRGSALFHGIPDPTVAPQNAS